MYIYIYIYVSAPRVGKTRTCRFASRSLGIHQRGVQWKQGVVMYMINHYITSYTSPHPVSTAPPFDES